MKIFKLSQVQELDKYTIENEPITSIDLMERAASAIFDSIRKEFDKSSKFNIVVGSGNNGGDGFVVARLLHMVGNEVCVHYCEFTPSISEDCKTNLERFQNLDGSKFSIITSAEELRVDSNEVIIDVTKKLHEFDQKGYFEFASETLSILDNVVAHFSIEDVKLLANNAVTILETVKSLTQPEMMQAISNAVQVFSSIEQDNIPSYSLTRAMLEMRKPEMKKALGFSLVFLKNISQNTNTENK